MRRPIIAIAIVVIAAVSTAMANALQHVDAPDDAVGRSGSHRHGPVTHLNGTPLQRPPAFGERRFLTDEDSRYLEAQSGQSR